MDVDVLDLRCSRPQEYIDAISALDSVWDAALFGAGLHLKVADAAKAKEDVENLFSRLGTRSYSVEKIVPSMEDVFVSLIEAEDRKEEGALVA